ncbi:peptidoglycan binding protein CsiV [Vibrio mytili]|uniref:peptidoglycan binding protein CsiV n=1 Tax=Vibrio mytili TaxID=50718 RepID=UPI002F40D917
MRILIPLLLLCVSMPTWAQRQFDIELIIFKRVGDAESTSESWSSQLPKIDMTNVGSLDSDAYLSAKGAALLPRSSYQLNAQEAALNSHVGFKVLKHVAWRQGDQGQDSAPIFRIVGGRDFSGSFNADGSNINRPSSTIANADVNATETNETDDVYVDERDVNDSNLEETRSEGNMSKALYELDGKFQVYVQHYLFADTTLDLREPSVREVRFEATPDEQLDDKLGEVDGNVQVGNLAEISPTVTEEKFLKTYRMEQKRRMRSEEIHYLDSPMMGVIIQVRNVE